MSYILVNKKTGKFAKFFGDKLTDTSSIEQAALFYEPGTSEAFGLPSGTLDDYYFVNKETNIKSIFMGTNIIVSTISGLYIKTIDAKNCIKYTKSIEKAGLFPNELFRPNHIVVNKEEYVKTRSTILTAAEKENMDTAQIRSYCIKHLWEAVALLLEDAGNDLSTNQILNIWSAVTTLTKPNILIEKEVDNIPDFNYDYVLAPDINLKQPPNYINESKVVDFINVTTDKGVETYVAYNEDNGLFACRTGCREDPYLLTQDFSRAAYTTGPSIQGQAKLQDGFKYTNINLFDEKNGKLKKDTDSIQFPYPIGNGYTEVKCNTVDKPIEEYYCYNIYSKEFLDRDHSKVKFINLAKKFTGIVPIDMSLRYIGFNFWSTNLFDKESTLISLMAKPKPIHSPLPALIYTANQLKNIIGNIKDCILSNDEKTFQIYYDIHNNRDEYFSYNVSDNVSSTKHFSIRQILLILAKCRDIDKKGILNKNTGYLSAKSFIDFNSFYGFSSEYLKNGSYGDFTKQKQQYDLIVHGVKEINNHVSVVSENMDGYTLYLRCKSSGMEVAILDVNIISLPVIRYFAEEVSSITGIYLHLNVL